MNEKELDVYVTKVELPPLEMVYGYLEQIWKAGWVTNNGQFLLQLERKLETRFRTPHVRVVSNGTFAIQLALRALGLPAGSEVITTPFTFIATTNALLWEGLTPVFADVDSRTYNIDPEAVEQLITPRTSAILAVHVYGNACDVVRLERIARKHNLKLIFDAAHAFDVEYDNRSIMSYGDASTLSFHATKVFHTMEGGAIVVKTDELNKAICLLRNFGIASETEILAPGTNAKLNELQAAVGLCNLNLQETSLMKRRNLYERYVKHLSGLEGISFQQITSSKYNYSYMPVLFRDNGIREHVYTELQKIGVKSRRYFYPLASDLAYVNRTARNCDPVCLPEAQRLADGILCLPLYPQLQEDIVDRIADAVASNVRS